MTYDQRCYDLAAVFLGDEPSIHTPEKIDALAKEIQTTIEDFISGALEGRVPYHEHPAMHYRP